MQRKSILVLGMHRSGTSALARMLNLLGCDLPKALMPKAPSNPKGHWESNAIMALNDDVLASAGSHWDDWQEFNPAWYESPIFDDFVQRATKVLHEDFGSSPLFVLKDPRNCRLVPFWLDVLQKADVLPLVVVPLRNPLEVADSLQTRDGISRDMGMLLWLRHVLDAEHGSRECRRVFLTYENMLDEWGAVAERMQDALGIIWPKLSIHTTINIEEFIDRDSRHHVHSNKNIKSNPMVSKWIRDAYEILRSWAESVEKTEDHKALDEIRQQLNVAGPAFAKLAYDLTDEQNKNKELRALLHANKEELAHLKNAHSTLHQRDEEMAQALATLEEKSRQLANVQAEHDARNEQLEQLRNETGHLREALSGNQHVLEDTQSTLRQREEEISQTLAAMDEKSQQLADAQAEHMEVVRRLEVAEVKLKNANEWVFNLAGQRRQNDEQIALLRSRLAATERKLESASSQLANVEKHYLDPAARARLLDTLAKQENLINELNIQSSDADQKWKSAQSEVIALSRLLRDQRAELARVTPDHADALRKADLRGRSGNPGDDDNHINREMDTSNSEVVALSKLLIQRQNEIKDLKSSFTGSKYSGVGMINNRSHVDWLQEVNAVVTGYPHWWAFVPKKTREKWQNGRLLRRGLFDAEAYLARYPDVKSSGISPLRHYIIHGLTEKRTFQSG